MFHLVRGTDDDSETGVQSVHRAFDLLEVVVERGGSATIGEIATAAGIPLATAHRLLRTLVERGYMRQSPDRRYALGFRLVPLGRGGELDGRRGHRAPARRAGRRPR